MTYSMARSLKNNLLTLNILPISTFSADHSTVMNAKNVILSTDKVRLSQTKMKALTNLY